MTDLNDKIKELEIKLESKIEEYEEKIKELESKISEHTDMIEKHKHSGKETSDISVILQERLGIEVSTVIGAAESATLKFGGFEQEGRAAVGQITLNNPYERQLGLRWSGGGTTDVVFITLDSVPIYANNAAAKSGGLLEGDIYRNGGDPDSLCIVK